MICDSHCSRNGWKVTHPYLNNYTHIYICVYIYICVCVCDICDTYSWAYAWSRCTRGLWIKMWTVELCATVCNWICSTRIIFLLCHRSPWWVPIPLFSYPPLKCRPCDNLKSDISVWTRALIFVVYSITMMQCKVWGIPFSANQRDPLPWRHHFKAEHCRSTSHGQM